MPRERGCPICDSSSRCFVCASCVNSRISDRHLQLQQLRLKRQSVLENLNLALDGTQALRQQQLVRTERHSALSKQLQRVKYAESRLQAVRESIQQQNQELQSRRARLEQCSKAQAEHRAEQLNNELPAITRIQTLTLASSSATLRREQRARLRRLAGVLPLTVGAIRADGTPLSVMLADLRLPDPNTGAASGSTNPAALSACLGYAVLLLDLVSTYLGGPLLHEATFRNSTSSIWTPTSFWNLAPPPGPGGTLPLYAQDAGALEGLTRGVRSTRRQLRTVARAAMAVLNDTEAPDNLADSMIVTPSSHPPSLSSWTSMPPPRTISLNSSQYADVRAGQAPVTPRSRRRTPSPPKLRQLGARAAELAAALRLLGRSVAALVADRDEALRVGVPGDWPMFAGLALVLSVITSDLRPSVGQSSVLAGVNGRALAQILALNGADAEAEGLQEEPSYESGGDDDEGDDEGSSWEALSKPLPPTPSETESIAHWERALITDAQHAPMRRTSAGTHSDAQNQYASPPSAAQSLLRRSGMLRQLFSGSYT